MWRSSLPFTVAFLIVLPVSLGFSHEETKPGEAESTHAVAVLHPTDGSKVSGRVTFEKVEGGVKVLAEVKGLSPGKHGFHIHEFGDCRAPDAASAGGHFNPMGKAHGAPTDAERHAGDLGNVTADADGNARLEWVDPMIRLEGPQTIIGRGVVVHAREDDLKTQPTGDAGGRVACGVIGVAKE